MTRWLAFLLAMLLPALGRLADELVAKGATR